MMRQLSFVGRVLRDRRGVATVEFALWSVLILAMLVVSADFGFYVFYKERLKRAVSEASVAAFASRTNIDPDKIAAYVTATARIPGSVPTVSVTCSGGNTCVNIGRTCGCISLTDGSFSTQASCGEICPSGALSSYYLTISARSVYHHVVLPNPWLEGRVIPAGVTVRLQ